MLHVNDDNNEELFRKAAENYPLKTGIPDWDGLLKKMNDATPSPPERKKDKRRALLFLLLLIPAVALMYYNKSSLSNLFSNTSIQNKTSVTTEKINLTPNDKYSADKTEKSPDESFTANDNSKQINDITGTEKNNLASHTRNQKNVVRKLYQPAFYLSNYEEKEKQSLIANRNSENKQPWQIARAGNLTQTNLVPFTELTSLNKETLSSPNNLFIPQGKDDPAIDDKTKPNKKKLQDKLNKRFYIGVKGGPDVSAIKLQSVNRVGWSVGLTSGYQLGKKFRIELAFMYDKKYYNTKGQYFNIKSYTLPPNYVIEYVDGSCKMWEMPLTVKYAISSKARSSLFAGAGFSSYFMKSEAYRFDVNNNGNRYPRSYTYHTKSNNLFAVANISLTYTHKVGKLGEIHVEPYIKLPVSKMGYGSLPIQSGGIQFGLIKPLF